MERNVSHVTEDVHESAPSPGTPSTFKYSVINTGNNVLLLQRDRKVIKHQHDIYKRFIPPSKSRHFQMSCT